MPTALIGGAISGGASLIGGLLGQNAAGNAGAAQAAAAGRAGSLAAEAGQQAQGYQTGQITREGQNAQPFVNAGQGTVENLAGLLQPGGQLTQGFGQFNAPTGVTEQNDPGYQFRLQQGKSALENSAAARGGLLSSGTAKNLNDYAQGQASNEYGNVYNRALETYGTNFNTFQANQGNLYNRLSGLAGLGSNAAANLNNVQQQGTNALTGGILDSARLQGQDIMGGGQAQAAGIVGGTNALVGGLTGAGTAFGQGIAGLGQGNSGMSLSQLLGAQNASGPTSGAFGLGNPYTGTNASNANLIGGMNTSQSLPSWQNS